MGVPPPKLTIGPPAIEKKDIVPVQRLSHIQMKEMWKKGICYNYDKKKKIRAETQV